MMKKIICLIFLNICITGCSQKKIKTEKIMKEPNIQKVSQIYKEVKKYEYNPSYTLHIGKAANFSFELLINDYPVYSNYDPGIVTGSIPINGAILKQGVQKLTVKMIPPVDKEYNMASTIEMENIEFNLRINYGEYGKEKVKDFKEIFKYELPKQEGELPYYEINLVFEAPVVPYENDIEGWSNGVDLTKEDKSALQKEVEAFYKEIISYYETKNINALAGKYYKRQVEQAKVGYTDKPEDSQLLIDEWVKDVNDKRPFIFNQYIMKFYGNGKMVALVKTDKYYLNYSALLREDIKTGNAIYYGMYLYRPTPNAPLEVIR